MSAFVDSVLIAGFLLVDALFFHDLFKAGEVTTLPQYLTGLLSIVVVLRSGRSLFRHNSAGSSVAARDRA